MAGGAKTEARDGAVLAAEMLLPAPDLQATLDFFLDELGFRLDAIMPADAPARARISGFGLQLCLDAAHRGDPGALRLLLPEGETRAPTTAPNGTRIGFAPLNPAPAMPDGRQASHICRAEQAGAFEAGRAGMLYRDLLPDRHGGRFIASHIAIPDGGPVPDMVHFHRVRFQLIACVAGWVRVVYEDQGPAFELRAGDCVLQPPEIRHRVLEASPGLEVVEIGCPAEHPTLIDHDLALPTRQERPTRQFGGQRFHRHHAAEAAWATWNVPELESRDMGIAAATHQLAEVRTVRARRTVSRAVRLRHDGEFLFLFVTAGRFDIDLSGTAARLSRGDAVTLAAGDRLALLAAPAGAECLVVALPAGSITLHQA